MSATNEHLLRIADALTQLAQIAVREEDSSMKGVCGNCCHFSAQSGVGDGECRRLPPQLFKGAELGKFPAVLENMWCGHWGAI